MCQLRGCAGLGGYAAGGRGTRLDPRAPRVHSRTRRCVEFIGQSAIAAIRKPLVKAQGDLLVFCGALGGRYHVHSHADHILWVFGYTLANGRSSRVYTNCFGSRPEELWQPRRI